MCLVAPPKLTSVELANGFERVDWEALINSISDVAQHFFAVRTGRVKLRSTDDIDRVPSSFYKVLSVYRPNTE